MKCYRKFAHIYDDLINTDINYNEWSEKIISLCEMLNINNGSYLDLACGTGNMTEKLAPHFQTAWGVDLSDEMLAEADKKLRNKGLKINLICQDISKLKLNKKFDLITCCLDSTNYILEESNLKNYFKNVFHHLTSNGIFIFDINSHYKITNILGNNTYTYDSEKVTYIWENFLEDEIVDMYLTFFIKYKDLYERFDEHHREKAYSCKHIENVLKDCNLNIITKLDNYQDKAINDTSQRIVYVVNRNI
ncbi:class I SAM-dependent DNA methyltransferase [Clostridium sp. WILCCON 0269]|uniref:Class I SAM-dependent DNA methyltransferase n=1 Tax=Candidatus Clostridium eludens TaxID=3381663 RepID=A0ABW8SHB1_9CLOT